MTQQIQIFTSQDGKAELRVALENDTVWLTQAQMGQLFDTTPENVLMHLQNIFKDDELDEQATTKEFLVVRQEGQRYCVGSLFTDRALDRESTIRKLRIV
jgi:hypothetical protein